VSEQPHERFIRILHEERRAWRQRFGAGMVAFDTPWLEGLRRGDSNAVAAQHGAEALLDAYTEQLRKRFERERDDIVVPD
jgi:hypothetical protein